jgi:hypothetical protein
MHGMGPIEKQMKELCSSLLRDIEAHIALYPMGEKYFGKRAGGGPNVIAALRSGSMVRPDTIDGIRAFMVAREATLAGAPDCPASIEGGVEVPERGAT